MLMLLLVPFWMVLMSTLVYTYEADLNLRSRHCLRTEETPPWQRTFHFNNHILNLTVEVSDNPSHWILNYIFGILAHERLGYQNITFVKHNLDYGVESVLRLACRDSSCHELPGVHINLESWLPVGTTVNFWASDNEVTDHGPLGPVSHWAFMSYPAPSSRLPLISSPAYDSENLAASVDSHMSSPSTAWRSNLTWSGYLPSNCNIAHCERDFLKFVHDSTGITPVESIRPTPNSSSNVLLFSWYPNKIAIELTVPQLCTVSLCNCSCGFELRNWLRPAWPISSGSNCLFESHQATKLSWAKLSTHLPLVHQLVSSMRLSQSEFDELLATAFRFPTVPDSEHRRSHYYNIACEWVRRSPNRWKAWTHGWNQKQNLTIAGLFTLYGKWVTDLHEVAMRAISFVNQSPDYFANTEYAITLDVRNLTCVQDLVVNDYFDLLLSSANTKLIGVIAALCSDSIEPVVEVANHRHQLIISPTVESARIVEKRDYPYFFRTIPSMLSANMALIRIFRKWGWRRIAVFRKDDHFFDPRLFQANDIEVIIDVEMQEKQLTYEFVIRNLKEMVEHNSHIFIIEHFAQGTAIVLCAAYHLQLHFDSGYVWFINPWLPDGWWMAKHIIPKECTFEEMANITSLTFTITHQILLPSMVNNTVESPDSSSNDHFDKRVRSARGLSSAGIQFGGARSRSSKQPAVKSESKITANMSANGNSDYAFYTYESVIVLTTALIQLLKEYPSAISIFDSPKISEAYRRLVANTNFAYAGRFNGRSIDSDSIAKLFSSRNGLVPPFEFFGDSRRKASAYVSQLRFNELNERVADYWLLKQHQPNGTTTIVMIYSKSGIPSTFFRFTNSAPIPSVTEFNQFVTERWLSEVLWGRNGGIPGDGSQTGEDCPFYWIMQLFSVSCVMAIIIFTLAAFLVIVLNLVLVFLVYYRRKLREAQRRIRQPYEDLCAELADIDIPCSDVVLNRRVGQGAFGMVFGGEAKRKGTWESVAVKVIGGKATYESKRDFLAEAKLMRELDHKNVVRLIGVCLRPHENHLYLIMENMLLGDLKTFLLPRRVIAQQSPDHEDIRPETLTQMAIDIAEGVAYLHSKFLVHRDIACRNCLVGSDRVVKIGDFGLTRKFTTSENEGYYRFTRNRELPIRWMSPEAVQFGVFSVHSDLWSYGIVLYEIITFGVLPYDGLGDVEVVERVKQIGFSILDFLPPAALNTTVAGLIDQCCQHQWQHRPVSMHPVIKRLRENPGCIRPFLTDEPPKPNKTIDALPFQPGAGACIMSEDALTGRNPTSTVAVAETVSANQSATAVALGHTRGFHSTTGSLAGTGRCSLTHCSGDSFSDATAAALRVVVKETGGRRRHKTADAIVGLARGTFIRHGTTSSSGVINGHTSQGSQVSFGEVKADGMAGTNQDFLRNWVSVTDSYHIPDRTDLNISSSKCLGSRLSRIRAVKVAGDHHALASGVPTDRLPKHHRTKLLDDCLYLRNEQALVVTHQANGVPPSILRWLSAECLSLEPELIGVPYTSVKSAPEGHPSVYAMSARNKLVEASEHNGFNSLLFEHMKSSAVQAKSVTKCGSSRVPSHLTNFCPPTPRSVVGNASYLLRSVFRIFTRSHKGLIPSHSPNHPLRSSKSTTSCRAVQSPVTDEDLCVRKPLLMTDIIPLVSTSCPPMLSPQLSVNELPLVDLDLSCSTPATSSPSTSPLSAPPAQRHFFPIGSSYDTGTPGPPTYTFAQSRNSASQPAVCNLTQHTSPEFPGLITDPSFAVRDFTFSPSISSPSQQTPSDS